MREKWLVALSNRSSIHIRLKPPDLWRIDIWLVQHHINVHNVGKKKEMSPDASLPEPQNYARWQKGQRAFHLQVFWGTANLHWPGDLVQAHVDVTPFLVTPQLWSRMERCCFHLRAALFYCDYHNEARCPWGGALRWIKNCRLTASATCQETTSDPPNYGPTLLLLFGFTGPECRCGLKSV